MKQCPHCSKSFSKFGIGAHIWKMHTTLGALHKPRKGSVAWNSGVKTGPLSIETKKKISNSVKAAGGQPHSDKTKKLLSEKMTLAHVEGRAYNIGYYKHKREPSYPEQFFMKVIANEFIDKDYVAEKQFHQYKLDFAWLHKKKCIEIDGQQHERKEHKERDTRKDALLISEGWQVLRIKWKDIFSHPSKYIKIAKKFIDA